jgi:predicted nucleotide-binding protein
MDFSKHTRFIRTGRHLLEGTDNVGAVHLAFNRWVDEGAEWLDTDFPSSSVSAEWSSLGASNLIVGNFEGGPGAWQAFRKTIDKRLAWLGKLAQAVNAPNSDAAQRPASPSGRIFVVHGHDAAARDGVARFVTQLKLEPIILHEQPSRGRTIIEKFLEYSDVGFAIVLLTADDVGSSRDRPDEQRLRARQNVIFELGFFIGKLGREKVAALYERDVEIPSDYQGVLFTEIDDAGAWRFLIAREMRAAGIPFDMNDLV